jgi:hypothetical protein
MQRVLSQGQEILLHKIERNAPEYQRIRDSYGLDSSEMKNFVMNVRQQCLSEQLILNDSYTGKLVGYAEVSQSLMMWLEKRSSETRVVSGTESWRLDHAIYWFHENELKTEFSQKLCSGGVYPSVTYTALFGLSVGHKLPSHSLEVCYFPRHGIAQLGSGGAHRFLACILWGELVVKPQIATLCTEWDEPDWEYNEALLAIESILPRESWVKLEGTLEERELLKRFFFESSIEDRKRLTEKLHGGKRSIEPGELIDMLYVLKKPRKSIWTFWKR